MKKKFDPLKLLLVPAFLALFIPVHIFVGNPFSKAIAGVTLKRYIEEKYQGCYFKEYSYDLTCNGYSTTVYSDINEDIKFVLKTDTFGFTIRNDSYRGMVELGSNTAHRLAEEYTELLNSILGNEICGYKIYRITGIMADNYVYGQQYSLKSGPLVPGTEYDIYKISPTDGDIHLRVIAPGATAQTAENILLETKQKLADSGIIFDTISLSIGEDSDCRPYIIDIEKIPYTVFSRPDFSRQIMKVHLKDNPQWSLAFRYINDRYDKLIKAVDWRQADSFEIKDISGRLNVDFNLQDKAWGNIMYISTDGLGVDDIDVINYESYSDSEIAQLGKRTGVINISVILTRPDEQAVADAINEINIILKNSGLENRTTNMTVTYKESSAVHSFPNLYYREDKFTKKEIQRYNQI